MEKLISDHPRKTMLWAIVLFGLSAIGGQALFALGAIVLFIFGALAWGSYDLHVAKRDYVPGKLSDSDQTQINAPERRELR